MKNKKGLYIVLLLLGIGLVCVGGFILEDLAQKTLSGVCIGIGAGLFGLSVANLVTIGIKERNAEIKRRIEIDAKDERTVRINDRARAKAFGVMEILYALLTLCLILMGEELLTVLLVIGVYVIGWVTYIVYFTKYAKEM